MGIRNGGFLRWGLSNYGWILFWATHGFGRLTSKTSGGG